MKQLWLVLALTLPQWSLTSEAAPRPNTVLLPTFVLIAGGTLRKDHPIDGANISKLRLFFLKIK